MPGNRRFVGYGIAPLVVGLALVVAYFFGPPAVSSIVAPLRDRELGLLENVENLLLLGCVVGCAVVAKRRADPLGRTLFLLLAAGFAFLFLEEIDYGHHFVRAIDVGNVHNVGHRTNWLRKIERFGVLLGFVALPLAAPKLPLPAWLRALVPRRESILTVVAGVLCCALAERLRLAGFGANHGLERNLSEFEEAFVYLLAALWTFERARPDRS